MRDLNDWRHEPWKQMFELMKPGTIDRLRSTCAKEQPTRISGLGGRRGSFHAIFWLISYGINLGSKRRNSYRRYLCMHPSGSELALLAEHRQGKTGEVNAT